MRLQAQGRFFKDETGCAVILRGIDIDGSAPPFPLDEAGGHFSRLKRDGLDFLRLAVTWRSLEHEAPGIYDQERIDSIHAFIEKAGEHHISLCIVPRHDGWRDGAPDWTLEAAGLDIDALQQESAAAWTKPFVSLTMFTLFFGGGAFAPRLTYQGQGMQDFLQSHYIRAFQHLAEQVAHLPGVIGFGTMGRLHSGLIGVPDLREHDRPPRSGIAPTPAQAIFLANGFAQACADFSASPADFTPARPKAVLDPQGVRLWQSEQADIWREQGIWHLDDSGAPHLLRPGHFARAKFSRGFFQPFAQGFAAAIHEVMPAAHIFVERPLACDSAARLVFAPVLAAQDPPSQLHLLRSLPGKQDEITRQIAQLRALADQRMGGVPILADISNHPPTDYARALDSHLLNCIHSSDIHAGESALSINPYAKKVAGEPLGMRFDPICGIFTFTFRHDPALAESTEIVVPNARFPDGFRVEVSDGEYDIQREEQRVFYRHSDKDIPHMIRIISNTPAPPQLSPYDRLAIIGLIILAVLTLLGRAAKKVRG